MTIARPYVDVTVIRAQRPTSARPGDRARVDRDGRIDGFVGGSCAEESVRLHALRVLETGEPLLLRIEPDAAGTTAGEGVVTVANPCLSGGALEVFLEPRLPPARMVVAGETPIADAVARLAASSGFTVERGSGVAGGEAAVVVASLGHDEVGVLESALEAGVPYVGLVASRRRGAAVLAALGAGAERVHTPAGLPLGAAGPAEIAIAILAEVVLERRSPGTVPEAVLSRPAAVAADADTEEHPVTAIDPVCGMEVAPVDATTHLDVDDRRVWFCSEHCRRAFTEHGHRR